MMAAVDSRGEDINAVVAAYIDANAASVDTLINAAKSR
jgi:ABC-type proline/glycine betaine transport system substrate-binding protein